MGRQAELAAVLVAALGPAVYQGYKLGGDSIVSRDTLISLGVASVLGVLSFALTIYLIPIVARSVERRGIFGKDINKRGTPAGEKPIPEALGLAVGVVFLVHVILFQQFVFFQDGDREWMVEYNAALGTICFALFLGFMDDVLEIPWRAKLILPTIASLPLLVAYTGHTSIKVPKPLQGLFHGSEFLELGILYQTYMCLLSVFCSNSINILAGINGLEAGQTFIISCSVLLHNLMQVGNGSLSEVTQDAHMFSAYLMIPLAATTFALLCFNWYPSRVFVGDTFTLFAGMALAVAGVLGHYSETLLLFFIPQVINFIYSIPQLFKFPGFPCPRHRLPIFDPSTNMLYPSDCNPQQKKRYVGGASEFRMNCNLVNLFLYIFGPCTEKQLLIRLLSFQFLCCAGAFGLRYLLAGVYKD